MNNILAMDRVQLLRELGELSSVHPDDRNGELDERLAELCRAFSDMEEKGNDIAHFGLYGTFIFSRSSQPEKLR